MGRVILVNPGTQFAAVPFVMWDEPEDDFGMSMAGVISGISVLSAVPFERTTSSAFRWADQEVRMTALDEARVVAADRLTAKESLELDMIRPRQSARANIGAIVPPTVQRHKLIESWAVLVGEIGDSSLTGRQIANQCKEEQEHILKEKK